MNFEEYLHSKKIDSAAFRSSEETLWENWKKEFEELHPASFTSQKLYLINPVRRKYHLKVDLKPQVALSNLSISAPESGSPVQTETSKEETDKPVQIAKPVVPRPVFKPKPKMN